MSQYQDTQLQLLGDVSPFDQIRRVDGRGYEFWMAKDLMPLLGYGEWKFFEPVISRAKLACQNTGNVVAEHFSRGTTKNSKGAGRPSADYSLSRFGAYLVAMNGDPRKPEIAAAQTYFAIKTREAETGQFAKPQEEPLEIKRLTLELAIANARCEEKRLEIQLRTIKPIQQTKTPKPPKPEKDMTPILLKIVQFAYENGGKVTDRVLVQKHWAASAKEARSLIRRIADMGQGMVTQEGRIAQALVTSKTEGA